MDSTVMWLLQQDIQDQWRPQQTRITGETVKANAFHCIVNPEISFVSMSFPDALSFISGAFPVQLLCLRSLLPPFVLASDPPALPHP